MSHGLSRIRRTALRSAALLASFGAAWGAHAESAPPAAPAAADQQRADKETELRGVEDTLRASEEQRRAIETEIESFRADRARLSAALIETTAKVQDAERGAAAAGDKLSRSLERRRAAIADVLAALQRMGSNPPPAILVKPNDMSEAVRAATVMGAVIPELKSETEAVRHDLDALAATRDSIARERDELTRRGQALAVDKMRLAALVDARQQSLASAQDALGSQRQRESDLARQATSLKDLIAKLDAAAAAAHTTEAAAAAEIEARARAARGVDPGRLKPEIAFGDAKGQVPLPAAGAILKSFGSPDGLGGTERGVSLATPAGATVSAPADGAVLFCGPYRTYGQLLIIDAGAGYYVLLAGMDRINVESGEFVLAGEPVGVMGDGSVRMATAAAVGAARPVLYIELRKDGTAIDPGPWWAKSDIEKARG